MSPLAQKLLEITKSERESKYWGLSTQARKKIERLIEEHDPKWETYPEEFDILIRDRTVDGKREARALVLGHEEELSSRGSYPLRALQGLNWLLIAEEMERKTARREAFALLNRAVRSSAGIPRWAPWRKVPAEHKAAWLKVVTRAEKECGEKGTNMQVAQMAVAMWEADARVAELRAV